MRVINNTTFCTAKKTHYGTAVRREGDNVSLFMVIDMFVGDGHVRLVNLASGKVLKIPEEEQLIIIGAAYVEIESGSDGFI